MRRNEKKTGKEWWVWKADDFEVENVDFFQLSQFIPLLTSDELRGDVPRCQDLDLRKRGGRGREAPG